MLRTLRVTNCGTGFARQSVRVGGFALAPTTKGTTGGGITEPRIGTVKRMSDNRGGGQGQVRSGLGSIGLSNQILPAPPSCPHGDATCPCQDGDMCHYEGMDASFCPNPPAATHFCDNLTFAHCHMEGCDWHVKDCAQRVSGRCGLLKLGFPPLDVGGTPMYSMTQARPGMIGFRCGWLRSPLNVSSSEEFDHGYR